MPACSQPRSWGLTAATIRATWAVHALGRGAGVVAMAASITYATVSYRPVGDAPDGTVRVDRPTASPAAVRAAVAATDRGDLSGAAGPAYAAYERRLRRSLGPERSPARRRHARRQPPLGPRAARRHHSGHQAGADKIDEFLGWCDEVGVEVVTLWLLSTDNLRRPAAELGPLLTIIENAVDRPRRERSLADPPGGRAGPAARRHGAPAQGGRRRAPPRSTA